MVFQDGFGERRFTVDSLTGEPVEALSFAPVLAGATSFGEAVGERVARLSTARHTMYARARKLDRRSAATLVLVSDPIEGWRLAHVLDVMEEHRLTLDMSAILVLLRQLLPAVALFSRHQRDAVIGTVGPERLILSPQGRLVLAEYALATGLERLQFSRERLWRDLRVAMPPAWTDSRLPPNADAMGVGVVALSLVLGRRLREDEFLTSLPALVEHATETHAGVAQKLSAGFSAWLARALQLDGVPGLKSIQEAQVVFEEVLAKERAYVTATASLELFLEKFERLAGPAPRPQTLTTSALRPEEKSPLDITVGASDASADPSAASGEPPVETQTEVVVVPSQEVVQALEAFAPDGPASAPAAVSSTSEPVARSTVSSSSWWKPVAAGLALLASVEALALGWMATRQAGPSSSAGEMVVHSRPGSARVTINGEERGLTPLTTNLPAGSHVVEVRVGRAEPRVIPVEIRGGVQNTVYVELQSVATMGGLEVKSAPAQARVSVAGQFRGTTPLVVKDLPPGEVEVLLQAGKRQVRQTVRIEPGITSQLVVPLDR